MKSFAVVLPGINQEQVASIAEAIRLSVASINLDRIADGFRVTISVGCHSAIPDDTDSPEIWLSKADEALYRAKENGRNRVECWSEEVQAKN